MRSEFKAHLMLLATALIYGANFTIAREILVNENISPLALVLYRMIAAFILFYIFHLFLIKERVQKKDLVQIFIMSVFGIVINQSFFIIGLKYTSPINASLLMTTVPIIVFIFSSLINKEKKSLLKISGIALGFSGVLIIILNKPGISFDGSSMKGDIFIFLNSVSYAYYLVKVKPLFLKYNPITIIKWMFLFGILCLLPFSFRDAINVNWDTFELNTWISFFYVLIFTTFFAYLFNNLALQKLNSSVVSIYIYLQPIIATLIAVIFIKDKLDLLRIIAGIMIFSGIYLVSYRKNR